MANVFRGLFRGLWDEVVMELLRSGFRGGKEIFAERVKSYIATNPRAALVITLIFLEPEERVNLMEAHRRAMREGWENRFVLELGQALPRKSDGSVDEDRAREILKQLNKVSPEELSQFLEFLNHDPIAQWIRVWVWGKGQEVALGVAEALAELAARGVTIIQEQTPATARKVDDWAANTATPAVHQFRMNQRWVKRSRRRRIQQEADLHEQEQQERLQREEKARERVAEFFSQFRHEQAERKGGRQ